MQSFESVDDIEKAWEIELRARSEAIKNNTLETYSKDEVLANLLTTFDRLEAKEKSYES